MLLLRLVFVVVYTLLATPNVHTQPPPHPLLLASLQPKVETMHNPYLEGVPSTRGKRTTNYIIRECVFTSAREGDYFYKAPNPEGDTCGIYLFTEPDQKIEIHFNYIDVPCEDGGLVSYVDGWEMDRQFFPNQVDHQKPMQSRFAEFCDQQSVKEIFTSSQNAAMLQHRIPKRGSFSFSVRFIKNPTPCNVLLDDVESVFTLRNYGKKINCSVMAIYPATVHVAALSVGIAVNGRRGFEIETGTLHKCQKRGLDDYAEIGGATGLDNSNLHLADAVCGIDSKPEKNVNVIGCVSSSVRLVSSGTFDNSVTISMRKLSDGEYEFNVICPVGSVI